MARRPFLPEHKGKHFCFDERGLEADIEASSLIGQIIARWSKVEHNLAMVLAALLGDHPAAGVALFSSLRAASAQYKAMLAVATVTLRDTDLLNVFKAVLKVVDRARGHRNDLAHGLLGWSFDLPGVTLWIKSDDQANYSAEAWFRFTTQPYDPSIHNHDALERKIFVYETSDLKEILNNIDVAGRAAFHLCCSVREGDESDLNQRKLLVEIPEVSCALNEVLRQSTSPS